MSVDIKGLQRIVREFRLAGEPWPAPAHDIARWAIERNRWKPATADYVRICAEQLARAMREEYMTDNKGRRVRVKHPATIRRGAVQMVLWDDIRTAPRAHMEVAFQQRRNQIVGDCRQLRNDVDSYNERNVGDEPIQLVLDFTKDVLELQQSRAA